MNSLFRLAMRVGFVGAVITAVTVSSVNAQVIVIQSSAKNLKVGQTIANDVRIKIPAGNQAIFVLPSGTTRTVSGPFDGAASQLTKGVRRDPSIFEAVKKYVKTGGATQKSVGATRSFAAPGGSSRSIPFSWNQLPLTANGDFCLAKDQQVELVRFRKRGSATVTLVDMRSQNRANVQFNAGSATSTWPEDLPLATGTYTLLAPAQRIRQVRIRLISPIPDKEDTLRVLFGQRCFKQFQDWLKEIRVASR